MPCSEVDPPPGERPPPLEGDHLLLRYEHFEAGTSSLSIWSLDTMAEVIDLTGDLGIHASDGTWSPFGNQIAYTSNESGSGAIWVIDVDGTDRRQVTSDFAESPDWSPDGATIAFGGFDGLWFVDALGCNQRLVFETDHWIRDVEWMPDGSAIILEMSDPEGAPSHLYSLSMPDFELTQLTFEGSNAEPALSRDGDEIVFRIYERGVGHPIFVMNSDGSDQRFLYDHQFANDFHPSLSPDSDRVAVEAIRDGTSVLSIVTRADGSTTDLVSSPFGEPRYRDPIWYHGVTATEPPSPGTETTTAVPDSTTTPSVIGTDTTEPGTETTTTSVAGSPSDGDGGVPTTVWLLLGAVGLIGAFAGGVLYAIKREARKPAPLPPPPPPPAAPEG